MSKSLKDRLDYLIALVSEFAAAHHLSLQQAYLYLQKYKGLDFADEFYDVEHLQSMEDTIDDLMLSHGVDTISIFMNMGWLGQFPVTYAKKYYYQLANPHTGPLSDMRSKILNNLR